MANDFARVFEALKRALAGQAARLAARLKNAHVRLAAGVRAGSCVSSMTAKYCQKAIQ